MKESSIWGQLVIAPGWYIEKGKGWILAYAESTPHNAPQKRPSYWANILGGMGIKCSGCLYQLTPYARMGSGGIRRNNEHFEEDRDERVPCLQRSY